MLVYSVDVNDSLIDEVTKIIQNIIDSRPNDELKLLGLEKFLETDFMERRDFDTYVFNLSNNKRYTVNVFDIENFYEFPSGLSTTYLDCKSGLGIYGSH